MEQQRRLQEQQRQLEQARQQQERQTEQARQQQLLRQQQQNAMQQERLHQQQQESERRRRLSAGQAPASSDPSPPDGDPWTGFGADARQLVDTARDVARDVFVDVEFGRSITSELMFDTSDGPAAVTKERFVTYIDEQLQGFVQEYVTDKIKELPGIRDLDDLTKDITAELGETLENVLSSSGPGPFELLERARSVREGLTEVIQTEMDEFRSKINQVTSSGD